MDRGWVKIYRKEVDWEWYKEPMTAHLFNHLVLMANRKDGKWRGVTVPRGCLITTFRGLAEQTGLSLQQVRTSIKRLISTHDITQTSTKEYTLLKVENYVLYQSDNTDANTQATQDQHTSNTQATLNKKERSKEVKKERKKPIYDACSVIQERYHSPKLIDAWMAFLEMRKSKKKPVSTERALTLLIKDLDKYGQTDDQKIAVLEQSVKNSWQGLYPLKGNDYGPNGSYTYRGAEYHSDYSNDIPWGDEGNV